jgi:hypothetical protein
MADPQDTMRWLRRGIALVALLIGWVFIAWQNHFHISAPVVFVALAYLAIVATIFNLWRTGAAVVASDEDGDSTWAKPAGALGELEREKRTLLKAIKEAEFDHEMGKLSQRDADEMIRGYRARAIEVIKGIDHIGLGAAGTPREQILREVRARIELDAKSQKKVAPEAKQAKRDKGQKAAAKDAPAQAAEAAQAPTVEPPAPGDRAGERTELAAAAALEANHADEAAAAVTQGPAAGAALDEMDADSTTSIEPARNHQAKEATR